MNDLLWLANHPLRGNDAGILTSWNPDTPEGLESRLFVRIHRILVELPHSTELELEKLRQTRADFGRASTARATPRTPNKLGSPPTLRISHLSLLYKEWTWEHYTKLNLTFFTPFARRSKGGIYRGLSQCFGQKWDLGGPLLRSADQLGWPGGQVSWPHWLWALDALCTDLPWHVGKAEFEKALTPSRPTKEVALAGPSFARLGPGFVPHHPLVSYSLWLCLILDILKICMDFSPYDTFPSSDVPEMVDQQNSWNSLVISTYLLYLEWKIGILAVNICILWPPTPPTLRVLLVSL
jgi:hypothetical protein